MRAWVLLPLAAIAGAATRVATGDAESVEARSQDAELARRVEGLSRAVAEERTALEELARDPAGGLARPGRADHQEAGVSEEAIADAVDRWLAAHAPEPEPEAVTPRPPAADLPADRVLAFLRDHPPFSEESEAMYADLRAVGRLDEVIALLEEELRAKPDDPEVAYELGVAYLQKLFGLGATPEAGQVAMSVDQVLARALELDPEHHPARLLQAISLSNWPPFMGKTAQAVEHFEILIGQLEASGSVEGYGDAWLYLGNLHLRSDDREAALAVWRRGLEWFPDDEELARQLELVQGQSD